MDKKNIGIIGLGHMGKTLYDGLLNGGYDIQKISTSNSAEDNRRVIERADWIILTVKPGQIKDILEKHKEALRDKILISAAAGITAQQLSGFTGNNISKIIRIMPNIPAVYNKGVIGFWCNEDITNEEKVGVCNVFSSLGKVIDCSTEDALNSITIVAACGPAFVAYFINSLIQAGEVFGLESTTAAAVALQTFTGTLIFLQETNKTPLELQTAVATKGGLTEKIIKQLQAKKIDKQFIESLQSGYDTIKMQK